MKQPVYKGWYSDIWSGWAFIHPGNDLWAHSVYATDCECTPRIDYENCSVIHHAFDGRDLIEAVQRGEKII